MGVVLFASKYSLNEGDHGQELYTQTTRNNLLTQTKRSVIKITPTTRQKNQSIPVITTVNFLTNYGIIISLIYFVYKSGRLTPFLAPLFISP